jgi:hypothetical protein
MEVLGSKPRLPKAAVMAAWPDVVWKVIHSVKIQILFNFRFNRKLPNFINALSRINQRKRAGY